MSTNEEPAGSARARFAKGLDVTFVILLAAMLALGFAVVVVQVVGLFFGSAPLVVAFGKQSLTPIMCAVAGIFGVLTLVLARAHGWKSTD
jgi:hypothetical protein